MMSSQSPSSQSSAGTHGGKHRKRRSKAHAEEAQDVEQPEVSQEESAPPTPEVKHDEESTERKGHKKPRQRKTSQGDDTTELAQKPAKQPCGSKGGLLYGDTPTPWDPTEATSNCWIQRKEVVPRTMLKVDDHLS